MTITYLRPRPGSWALPGSVLLVGQWRGDRFKATVYRLNLPCRMQVPYSVAGSVNRDGVLTLAGSAALIDNNSCAVIGWA